MEARRGAALGEQAGAALSRLHRTIRRAIDELVAEQILVRQQGRGTFVAVHTPKQMLFRFFHLVTKDGVKESPETRTVAFSRDRASEPEARRLNLLSGERIIRVVNLELLASSPVAVDHIVLAQDRFPDLTEKIMRERDNTTYSLYQTATGSTWCAPRAPARHAVRQEHGEAAEDRARRTGAGDQPHGNDLPQHAGRTAPYSGEHRRLRILERSRQERRARLKPRTGQRHIRFPAWMSTAACSPGC